MKSKGGLKLTKEVVPAHAAHPGILIADELEHRGIKQKDLADTMEIAPTTLNEIIHGKRNLTTGLSLKLEEALDIDAAYWMRLQVRYEIDSIRIKSRNNLRRTLSGTAKKNINPLPIKKKDKV